MISSPDPALSTIAAYDAGAAGYSEHSRDRKPLKRLHERFVTLIGSGATVLDLGCGPGHDAAELSARGLGVTAFDPARGLLHEAARQPSLAGLLVQGDARALPFAAATFDGIWSCASLLHVPKRDVGQVLVDTFRVLKRGGILFTSMSEGDQPGAVPVESNGLSRRLYYYHREQTWAALVSGAGFEVIDHAVKRDSAGLNPGSTGWIETFARRP
jgi:ubiquinone/menaquinone biosynthesis C-methylase UbiE